MGSVCCTPILRKLNWKVRVSETFYRMKLFVYLTLPVVCADFDVLRKVDQGPKDRDEEEK